MLDLMIVEDNHNLRSALKSGLEKTEKVQVVNDCDSGLSVLSSVS